MIMYRKPALLVTNLATVISFVVITGCSTTALPPGKSVIDVSQQKAADPLATQQAVPMFPPSGSGFPWASQTLKASGQGSAPEGMPAAQASLTASNAARAHAIGNLRSQVKALPVGSDQTVGSIMDTYLTIRHAIDQNIATAQVSGQRPTANGNSDVEVSLQMQNIAAILQQYQITTDQELPAAADLPPAGVPDMI